MHDFTWFGWLSNAVNHHNIHLVTLLFVSLLIAVISFLYSRSLQAMEHELIPDKRVSLKNVVQVTVEKVYGLAEGIIGHGTARFFPLIGAIFIFVFLNNIMGLIPGFLPATDNINVTLGVGLTAFVYYNYVGIKKHGVAAYFKHLLGPVWWLAPLFFAIELVSHWVRPASLGLRLFGNMTGDHIVLSVFSNLVPLGVPVIFLGLGLFISFVQAFVFSLLTAVYIGLAVAEDESH
jgi:F-type H+-transporting ATPase subunit a